MFGLAGISENYNIKTLWDYIDSAHPVELRHVSVDGLDIDGCIRELTRWGLVPFEIRDWDQSDSYEFLNYNGEEILG